MEYDIQREKQEIYIVETNPRLFVQGFLDSEMYKGAFNAYFEEKNISSDVTQEEMQDVFLKSQEAGLALVDYGQKNTQFRYDPAQFTDEENGLIHAYMQKVVVRDNQDPDEIRKYERERTRAHKELAEKLTEGKVPNTRMGLILARFIIIDRGFDTYDSTRQLVKNMHLRGVE